MTHLPAATPSPAPRMASHELRFTPLAPHARGMVFPCDAHGRVDLDAMPARARSNYLFARTVVGREFFSPVVRPACAP